MNSLHLVTRLWARFVALLEALQPLAQLAARLYVAQVFFMSGLTKVRSWHVTVALFTDEYHVPLLPPEVAAAMASAGELALPVLLVLGLGGRFAALGLFVINAVAVISYPALEEAAVQQHVFWGSLLVGLALWGPGRWSLDRFIAPRLERSGPYTRAA
jgi:putative oxidoreductase